jgi:phage/plasmid primase-like uncharacterized protein
MSASTPESALSAAGIPCDKTVTVDGKLHRFKTAGDHDANCWYVFHQGDGIVCGAFGCWKRQLSQKWSDIEFQQLSKEQREEVRKTWADAAAKQRADQEKAQTDARAAVSKMLLIAPPAKDHPYLDRKEIKPCGDVRISPLEHTKGWLVVPLKDERGVTHSCQFIADDGTKRFFYGGRVQGCYFEIPGKPGGPILICEGYATGCSLFEATGWSVACAMNCGNLLATCQSIRRLNPARTIVVCADNDQFTEGNPGLEKAMKAASAISSEVVFPTFPVEHLDAKPTDFNDLAGLLGIPELRVQVNKAFAVTARSIGDFELPPVNDPSELLRHRFLCRRGALMLTGPTGVGKSSLMLQALALWANNLPFFGITPARPINSLLIQAENDDGDMAEMRNGICTGLKFNEYQRSEFFRRVVVHCSTGITGRRLCEEVVRPLLDIYGSDLLGIDPALSFLGGDVKDQKDVGNFLRQFLNPELYSHDCACLMSHHTNKPKSGNDDKAPMNGEWAYQGSGSAEWANWARAVISLQSSREPGTYKLHAGKRGARIGWRDEDDQIMFEKIILHSREKGVIYWTEGTQEEFSKSSSKREKTVEDLMALIPTKGSIPKSMLIDVKAPTSGVGQKKARALLDQALEKGSVFLWKQKRPGTNPLQSISRFPQPDDPIEESEPVPEPPEESSLESELGLDSV